METAKKSNSSALDAAAEALRTGNVVTLTPAKAGGAATTKPASRELIGRRLAISLRDFGRVSALLSTCEAALPAECAVGEPDVRGTIEVAQRMLCQAMAGLEAVQD